MHPVFRLPLVAAAGLVFAIGSQAQQPILQLQLPSEERVSAVAGLGDGDGDGKSELLLASSAHREPDETGTPVLVARVYLYSAHGALIGQATGFSHSRSGAVVAALGDIDEDGKADFAVGAPSHGDGGSVFVFSGASCFTDNCPSIFELQAENEFDNFGNSVAGVGDVDGDRVPDLAVGA